MGITADQERSYFDRIYAGFLKLPDHALVTSTAAMRAALADPSQTIYERRLLYEAVLDRLLAEPLAGRSALDYGCGPGEWGVVLATEGAHATLLDLSPAAIELGLRRARASGVAHRVRGFARDACDLSCFADEEFDLIFASAALHHTLKYPHALAELVRVLRKGGRLVLAETYGNNRLLNFARRMRAWLSREPAEQGEEIILSDAEIAALRMHFRSVEVNPVNLLAMAKRLFRGRFTASGVRAILGALEHADRLLLRIWPGLLRSCGEAVIVARK